MNILELIEKLDGIGWIDVVLAFVLIVVLIPTAIESWNRFISKLGYEPKKSLREKEIDAAFIKLENELKNNQEALYDRQERYHQQSIDIRDQLKKDQSRLAESQEKLNSDIRSLTEMFENYMKIDNKRTIATLRSSLWRMHREFIDHGYVTPDGLKTFKEMGEVYEEAGGDDIYHEKLMPEVMALEIRYSDGGECNIKDA